MSGYLSTAAIAVLALVAGMAAGMFLSGWLLVIFVIVALLGIDRIRHRKVT